MDNSPPSSAGKVLVALVVGAVVGYAIAKVTTKPPTPLDVCHTAGNHNIRVSSGGQLDCPEVTVLRTSVVTWFAPAGSTLSIGFPSGTGSVICASSTCYTTALGTVFPIDYTGTVTDGVSTSPITGRIIINK